MKNVDTQELYKTSRTMLGERNDCVVRAIASAFNCSYELSHKYCKDTLGRINRKGVFFPEKFTGKDPVSKHAQKALVFERRYLRRVSANIVDKTSEGSSTGMYLKKFIERYNKGVYIILSSGHAYTVKDGVVYGNLNDHRTYVKVAYKVTKTL